MKHQAKETAAPKNDTQQAPKKRVVYSSPNLRVYGPVGVLTKGSGGTKTDGTMMNKA